MGNIDADPEQLLSLARKGDGVSSDARAAQGRLLELYRGYLAILARLQIGRRLQGKVDAADLVQDTFLEAHRHFSSFRGTSERELVSWLRKILAGNLANLLRRYLGTQGRDVRLERDLVIQLDDSSRVLEQGLAAPTSSPSQKAVRREQAVLLSDALNSLPSDYREVIILRHLEGLTFPEIGQRLERTVDSVEKLWLRALARLRNSLEGP
jgi:RNA polymerase sigma-70 factor (ECF subfamily)